MTVVNYIDLVVVLIFLLEKKNRSSRHVTNIKIVKISLKKTRFNFLFLFNHIFCTRFETAANIFGNGFEYLFDPWNFLG